MLGLTLKHRAPVIIDPYSADWPRRYEEEQRRLRTVLPAHFRLEHIGSTSVPGLPAKPIIDVMLGASSLREIEEQIPKLESLGYEYVSRHEAEIPARRFFAKPTLRPRHFHLHGVVQAGDLWADYLALRDRLRKDTTLAARYAALKFELAAEFGDDRAGYTDAKTEFILSAIGRPPHEA